jgi:membrane-bound lytic murein transglycosylase MltF
MLTQITNPFNVLKALNRRLREKRIPPVKIVAVDESLETEDILELVNTGALERTVADSHIAKIWSKVLKAIRVHANIRLREDGRIAWAVRKNNPKLKQSLNHFVRQHRKGTLLGNIFFQRYYEKKQWISNPLDGDGNEKIERLRPLLEKYADQYRFDWRLILAMAFQESKLNPNRWFRNVELAVLHTVGREPVAYVSNINKYFVIYSHALEGKRMPSGLVISKYRSFN